MSSVAPSPPEKGQLVSVRSRQRIVNDVRRSALPAPALKPTFSGLQHLLALASVVAMAILAEAKKKRRPRRRKAVPTDKLALRLVRALERYKERWNPDDLSELASTCGSLPTPWRSRTRRASRRRGGEAALLSSHERLKAGTLLP